MGMQASRIYRMRYMRTLEAQSTGEGTILRKQGLSYLHYTAGRENKKIEAAENRKVLCGLFFRGPGIFYIPRNTMALRCGK